jgi:hypothetical protein
VAKPACPILLFAKVSQHFISGCGFCVILKKRRNLEKTGPRAAKRNRITGYNCAAGMGFADSEAGLAPNVGDEWRFR